jgi:hypothetical protein
LLTEIDGNDGHDLANPREADTICRWGIGDDVRSSLRVEDEEDDQGVDPRVLLKGVDDLEAEDGDDVGDDGDDDNADGDGHLEVRDGAEDLTDDDIVDDTEATTLSSSVPCWCSSKRRGEHSQRRRS